MKQKARRFHLERLTKMTITILLIAVAGLAYANGANDNFKGVATLFGTGTTSYRKALGWAALTTFAGSMTAVLFAHALLANFTGRGLVADHLTANATYVAAVAAGAGLTVLLATRLGLPVSTTHSLVGALLGAGWTAGSSVSLARLGNGFFLPLLLSPMLAIIATCILYPIFRITRLRLGITEQSCVCIGTESPEMAPLGGLTPLQGGASAAMLQPGVSIAAGSLESCSRRYQGRLFGVEAAALLDRLHFLSAGVVSFARGLNDTPKIAALLLVTGHLSEFGTTAVVGGAIAVGGLLQVRRVALTQSRKITAMNHGQGFTANLVTGLIVIAASRLGLPVSTTHVSCGALFGIGLLTRTARLGMISAIIAAWLITLPISAALGALSFLLLTSPPY